MDTLWSVIKLMTPNCLMATVDLKDAYYSFTGFSRRSESIKHSFGRDNCTNTLVVLMAFLAVLENSQSCLNLFIQC